MNRVALILVFASLSTLDAQTVKMRELPKDLPPFKYVEAKVPFYPRFGKGKTNLAEMQLPLAPAESLRHMVTPVDFKVQLVAAEPDIRRPICMTWDERGRLWIAESIDYPNELQPKDRGRDRIVICEDTDGDGRMDKFTVFADKLSIPTSMAFAHGGLVVHQAPHTLFLRDNDGDDVADERLILFSGWSTGDTHAGPSNLHYGLDNWLWGVVGYSGFRGTIGSERQDFRTGLYRFHVGPPGKDKAAADKAAADKAAADKAAAVKLEFLRNTSNNTWGFGISEDGLVFASTANGNPSVYLPIPNRYYESVRGWSSSVLGTIATSNRFYPITDKVRQVDYHGGFTAAAGHALYTARLYPKNYWNRTAFVAEPTGHLVATFELERKGTDFVSRNAWNLLASDDEWTSPIMAEVGPDGCVWIIDWYNYIVQHNPTPAGFKTGKGNAYETPLRDKTHGRIIKLVPVGAKLPAALDLKKATPAQLVAALKSDNLFWRRHAQRLLVERGKKDVVPDLIRLTLDREVDAIGLNVGAIHALWTLHGLGALDGHDRDASEAVALALTHKSPAVRRAAVMVAPRSAEGLKIVLGARSLEDADPHARLAALLFMAEMPPSEGIAASIASALSSEENLKDRWIVDAATAAAARSEHFFLLEAAQGRRDLPARALPIVARVAEHVARGEAREKALAGWDAWVKARPEVFESYLKGLVKGWPKGGKLGDPGPIERVLPAHLARLSTTGKADLTRLAAIWGLKAGTIVAAETAKGLWAVVENDKEAESARIAAARQVLELDSSDGKSIERILGLISPRTPPGLGEGWLDSFSLSVAADLAPLLLKRMPELSPALRAAGLRVLLARAETTRAMLDAIDAGKLALGDLTLDQKQALLSHPDKTIAQRSRKLLESGGGLPDADRQKVVERFLPLLAKKASADGGKLMFKKHCAVCHIHGSEGTKVGPDLTGMAVHPKAELLIHILDPSRSVEGNYRLYQVATLDGKFLSGMLASESKTAVELVDSQGKKLALQRDEIETLRATPKSIMPEGFEKQMSDAELLDLLEFLTLRGRHFPLPLDRVANVVSTQGMFITKESTLERLILEDWKPRTFKGIPFTLIDPRDDRIPNVLMLHGPSGYLAPKMPRAVKLPCNSPAAAIHFLSGVSGWGHPASKKGTVTMIVRLHYDDGKTEDHELINGVHFADYIRRVDVPGSEFAFAMRGQQMRYLAVHPKREVSIREIELIKGEGDGSAPLVLAITVEGRDKD